MRTLFASNHTTIDVDVNTGDWLTRLTFGWFPLIGYGQLRKKDDINRLVRIIKNICDNNDTYTKDERHTYKNRHMYKSEIQYIRSTLIPFLENAPELVDELTYYDKIEKNRDI